MGGGRGIAPHAVWLSEAWAPVLASRSQTCDSLHRDPRARLDFPALPATSGLL